ncbi:MAG: SPOR domain-containing protein [Candidatus Omnitrophica bacterium]|nr:SPOR domain-containing protein [Candidatus Omnitrophota bacterium]
MNAWEGRKETEGDLFGKTAERNPIIQSRELKTGESGMKNSWLMLILVLFVIALVVVVFRYRQHQKKVALNEVFPQEEVMPVDVEYEFSDDGNQAGTAKPVNRELKVPGNAPQKLNAPNMKNDMAPATAVSPTASATESPLASPTAAGSKEKKNPAKTKSGAKSHKSSSGTLSIQVAAFHKQAQADAAVKKLAAKGFEAFYTSREAPGKGTYYRVLVGKYKTKSEAAAALEKVKEIYKDSFITGGKK